jgi:protocatechuate 3,4-dioxygenase beta subunit
MQSNSEHIEHDDDRPVGRILNRREMLTLLAGMGGAVLLAACDPLGGAAQPTTTATQAASAATGTPLGAEAATATLMPVEASPTADAAALPSCVVRPELTEGPYFVDEKLDRSDIRPDPSDGSVREGILLTLAFVVSQVSNSCTPLRGAQVDVWHCDAEGVYSDATDRGFNTVGQKFLRGYQVTDESGRAQFMTIYPGWYQGRAVHIHFKIRTDPVSQAGYEFTSQLFFDESITDQVHAQQPYAAKGRRTLLNDGDGIYRNGGSQLLLTPTRSTDGYAATFDIGLQMS